jgi:L-alanine-DL-glutamate epimerase-like enolase superfamily enzyme
VSDAIRSIETGVARIALPRPLRIGSGEIRSREYAAVRVTTESGLVGKAYCLTREAPVAECVRRLVAPALLGADASEPELCWQRAARATILIGRVGLVVRAVGLVDIALWDIAAQRAGLPLWQLLGGSAEPVPVMLVAAYPTPDRTPEELAADVIRGARNGYRLLKVSRDADPLRMRALLESAYAGLPDNARIVVDASFAWPDATTALAEISQWGDSPLAWLEDPVVPEDAANAAALRRGAAYPIGIGDEVSSLTTYAGLLDASAIDRLRLDVVAIGGVTAARTVQRLAAEHAVPVSFHVYPELSVQLAAAGGGIIETFDRDVPGGNPLDPAHTLISSGDIELEAGASRPPLGPGLGFDLDWERFDVS